MEKNKTNIPYSMGNKNVLKKTTDRTILFFEKMTISKYFEEKFWHRKNARPSQNTVCLVQCWVGGTRQVALIAGPPRHRICGPAPVIYCRTHFQDVCRHFHSTMNSVGSTNIIYRVIILLRTSLFDPEL